MAKRPFIRKQKRRRHGTAFWDQEYTNASNLQLSENESEDLAKFTRWLSRQKDALELSKDTQVIDLGCGNGRNLVFLSKNFGTNGLGFDSSSAAIAAARQLSTGLPITYEVRSIADPVPVDSLSKDLALDMMSSHFLNQTEREQLRDEIYRILKPGGWLFMKTFLLDGDKHTERLLKEYPGKEANTYIHPVIGVPEHVFSESELVEFLSEKFIVHKVYRSHKHISRGKARKRRTVSVYAQKDPYK